MAEVFRMHTDAVPHDEPVPVYAIHTERAPDGGASTTLSSLVYGGYTDTLTQDQISDDDASERDVGEFHQAEVHRMHTEAYQPPVFRMQTTRDNDPGPTESFQLSVVRPETRSGAGPLNSKRLRNAMPSVSLRECFLAWSRRANRHRLARTVGKEARRQLMENRVSVLSHTSAKSSQQKTMLALDAAEQTARLELEQRFASIRSKALQEGSDIREQELEQQVAKLKAALRNRDALVAEFENRHKEMRTALHDLTKQIHDEREQRPNLSRLDEEALLAEEPSRKLLSDPENRARNRLSDHVDEESRISQETERQRRLARFLSEGQFRDTSSSSSSSDDNDAARDVDLLDQSVSLRVRQKEPARKASACSAGTYAFMGDWESSAMGAKSEAVSYVFMGDGMASTAFSYRSQQVGGRARKPVDEPGRPAASSHIVQVQPWFHHDSELHDGQDALSSSSRRDAPPRPSFVSEIAFQIRNALFSCGNPNAERTRPRDDDLGADLASGRARLEG